MPNKGHQKLELMLLCTYACITITVEIGIFSNLENLSVYAEIFGDGSLHTTSSLVESPWKEQDPKEAPTSDEVPEEGELRGGMEEEVREPNASNDEEVTFTASESEEETKHAPDSSRCIGDDDIRPSLILGMHDWVRYKWGNQNPSLVNLSLLL